jgi:hypothetical protein
MYYRVILILWVLLIAKNSLAQSDSTAFATKPEVLFNGFADVFYSYDFNKPSTDYRQSFLFNHNRHNEFNVNLALLQAEVTHQKYHGLVGIQTGTYSHDNYSAEKDVFKLINQAYAGIALNKKNNLWIDAGVFSSHLGFESAISMDNLTLTRSLIAENSPYFLTGAKIYYQTAKTKLLFIVCNGWQRIQRLSGNSLPGFGTQIQHVFSDKITFNWSTYTGSEYPDSLRKMRAFNNLYFIFHISGKWKVIADYDVGVEQRSLNSNTYNMWQGASVIARYIWSPKIATAVRGEYYSDPQQIIISTGTNAKYIDVLGTSLNIDYQPAKNVMWRIEGRYFYNSNSYFLRGNKSTNTNFFITSSIAVKI